MTMQSPLDVQIFFTRGLFRSVWFWSSLVLLACLPIVLVLIAVITKRPLGWRWPFLIAVIGHAVIVWSRSVEQYNRVRALDIDWTLLGPEAPLYSALTVAAEGIKQTHWAYASIAFLFAIIGQ